jgi:hypothetical protein
MQRALTLAMALGVVSSAAGQAPRPAEIAAARQLAREGFRLADAGSCAAAIEPLARADAIFHAPTILERLAECHLAVGKLVQGTEELRRVLVEDLGPAPSRAFVAAKARARSALATAEARLARLTLQVLGGADPRHLVLRLDGETLSPSLVGLEIPVDPGTHKVKVEAEGYTPAEGSVVVAEGSVERLELELVALQLPPPSATQAPRAALREPGTTQASRTAELTAPAPAATGSVARTMAFVSLGVGVAGLGLGVGFGLAALGDKRTLDAACVDQACPGSASPTLSALKRDATLSTVGWAVCGVGVVASLVLFLLPARLAPEHEAWLVPTARGLEVRW